MIVQSLVALNSSTWSAITVPTTYHTGGAFLGAKSVVLDNNESGAVDINRRILDTDANSQKLLPVGMQEVWGASSASGGGLSSLHNTYFQPGQTIAYGKTTSGSFNLAVTWIP